MLKSIANVEISPDTWDEGFYLFILSGNYNWSVASEPVHVSQHC